VFRRRCRRINVREQNRSTWNFGGGMSLSAEDERDVITTESNEIKKAAEDSAALRVKTKWNYFFIFPRPPS
jgi:hypothetical protein